MEAENGNMPTINIPLFVKNMGHKILHFILNLEENQAIEVCEGRYELDADRAEILNSFIGICRQLRMQGIDQGDVDFSVFHTLPQILQDERHIFNVWHENLGGGKAEPLSEDPLVKSASKIALEIYPLFLIKLPSNSHLFINTFSHLSSLTYKLEERGVLIDAIMNDVSMSKLFTNVGENDMDTHCQYMASSGIGGGIQLAVFPNTLVANAYELMKLRGEISQQALLSAVEETIQMLREIGEGNQIEVPAFVGFHNVGFDDFSEMDIESGKLRAYNDEILSLLPNEARPSTLGGENKVLGLLLEYKYPYKVKLGPQDDNNRWPPELEQARKQLEKAKENLSFTLALAIDRSPPIGITQAWTLVFDPLSQGTSMSWSHRARSPMPHYLLKHNEMEAVIYWSKLVNESNDEKIRLAIRRILSSINERMNPIDGFIDAIIAWENLFGGNAELSYRISVSIAKLLAEAQEERLEIQSKIVKFYTERSKIVHGVKEITHDVAIQKRDECLKIALEVVKKLYEDHHELLIDADRSKKLALL